MPDQTLSLQQDLPQIPQLQSGPQQAQPLPPVPSQPATPAPAQFDPDAFVADTQATIAASFNPDEFVASTGRVLADQARKTDMDYRAGKISLTPDQVLLNNAAARQGMNIWQSAAQKAVAGAKQLFSGSPWQGTEAGQSLHPEAEQHGALDQVWQGVKGAVSDEYNLVKNRSYMENLKDFYLGGAERRMGVSGAAATARAIPGMVETAMDAARLVDPYQAATTVLSPKTGESMAATQDALMSALTHYTSATTNAVEDKLISPEDKKRLDSQIAAQIDPLIVLGAVPMGEAGGIEKGLASMNERLMSGLYKGATAADRYGVTKGVGTAAAGAAAATIPGGHAVLQAAGGAAGGALVPKLVSALKTWIRGEGSEEAGSVLSKAPFDEVVAAQDAIIHGETGLPWQDVRTAFTTRINNLQQEADHFLSKVKGDDLKDLTAVRADGGPVVSTSNLSGDAKKVRLAQEQIADLGRKLSSIDAKAKANRYFDSAAKYLMGVGESGAIGGAIGAGFTGATTPPGETEGMGQGAAIGSVLGLAGGLAGAGHGIQALRAEKGASALTQRGITATASLPEADRAIHTSNMTDLNPAAQRHVNILAGAADAMGGDVVVGSPEQLAQKIEEFQSKAPRSPAQPPPVPAQYMPRGQVPAGLISPDGKTMYLNKDTLNLGTANHEITHLTQQFFGKTLRAANPEVMQPFDQAYQKSLPKGVKSTTTSEEERDAEIGRILLNKTPLENFYGGENIIDATKRIARKMFGLGGDYRIDPVLKAPYNPADLQAMRERMFQLGEQAAKNVAVRQPQAPKVVPADLVKEVSQVASRAGSPPIVNPAVEESARDKFVEQIPPLKAGTKKRGGERMSDAAAEQAGAQWDEAFKQYEAHLRENGLPAPETPDELFRAVMEHQLNAPPAAPKVASAEQEAGAPAEVEHPDYQAIRQKAESAKYEALKLNSPRKTDKANIERAGIEAMAQAHAKVVGPDSDLVTWRTTRHGQNYIGGRRMDPNDPFHAHLIDSAGLSDDDVKKLNFIEGNMGNMVAADYFSAPIKEEASELSRKLEQAEVPAEMRRADIKEKPVQMERFSKSYVPTGFTFNLPSKTFEVNGWSPDKFLNNVKQLIPWAKSKGLDAYEHVNDPQIVTDMQDWNANHKHGYTAMGNEIKTPQGMAPLVNPDPDYKPVKIPEDRAALLNLALNNPVTGDVMPPKKTFAPESWQAKSRQEKLDLRTMNDDDSVKKILALRKDLGQEKMLLENPWETLAPELVENLRKGHAEDVATIRPSGFKGDKTPLAEEGAPNATYAAAGFMPQPSKPFYSQLERNIEAQPDKASPQQLRAAILKGPGGKAELQYTKDQLGTSFDQWLKDNPQATKQQMLDFVSENKVKLKEINYGDLERPSKEEYDRWDNEISPIPYAERTPEQKEISDKIDAFYENPNRETKYNRESLQLPGGRDYGETLVQLPKEFSPELMALQRERDAILNIPWNKQIGNKEQSDRFTQLGKQIEEGLARERAALGPNFETGHWDEPNVVLHLRHTVRDVAPDVDIADIGERLRQVVGAKSVNSLGSGAPEIGVRKGVITEDEAKAFSNAKGFTSGKYNLPPPKMFFLEELQSDWAQKGRREGYTSPNVEIDPRKLTTSEGEYKWVFDYPGATGPNTNFPAGLEIWKSDSANAKSKLFVGRKTDTEQGAKALAMDVLTKHMQYSGVPDMPFKNSWKTLGLKVALRKAIESGADSLGWTTGEQQAERNNLSKHLDEVIWNKDSQRLLGLKNGKQIISEWDVPEEALPDYVGKEVANKLLQEDPNRTTPQDIRTVAGIDLRVGGEGMKGFYDKELVNLANDLAKKWGVRVGDAYLKPDESVRLMANDDEATGAAVGARTVHSLPITDAMKRDVLEKGQAMFMPQPKELADPSAPFDTSKEENYHHVNLAVPVSSNSDFSSDHFTSVDTEGNRYVGPVDDKLAFMPQVMHVGDDQYYIPSNLLGTGSDPKTSKGEPFGVRTYIMYLAAQKGSGVTNVCKFATEECTEACLGKGGMGTFTEIKDARINKTKYWHYDEAKFIDQLDREITRAKSKAENDGMKLAIRLNGTSDIEWEKYGLIQKHPDVQFYDYTKYPSILRKNLPDNYHITYSYTGKPGSEAFSKTWNERNGTNTAVVFGNGMPATFLDRPVVDGDVSDLRFMDPKGVIVGLHAKGPALKLIGVSQFIHETPPEEVAIPYIHPQKKARLMKSGGQAAIDAIKDAAPKAGDLKWKRGNPMLGLQSPELPSESVGLEQARAKEAGFERVLGE